METYNATEEDRDRLIAEVAARLAAHPLLATPEFWKQFDERMRAAFKEIADGHR